MSKVVKMSSQKHYNNITEAHILMKKTRIVPIDSDRISKYIKEIHTHTAVLATARPRHFCLFELTPNKKWTILSIPRFFFPFSSASAQN